MMPPPNPVMIQHPSPVNVRQSSPIPVRQLSPLRYYQSPIRRPSPTLIRHSPIQGDSRYWYMLSILIIVSSNPIFHATALHIQVSIHL